MCNCIVRILLTIFIVILEIKALPHYKKQINNWDLKNSSGQLVATNNSRSFNYKRETWKNRQQVETEQDSNIRSKRESDIVFAEEEIMLTFLPKPPKNCTKRSTFCEDVDEYPEEYIHRQLSENAVKYEELFGVDYVIPEEDIKNRFSGNAVEETLCASSEELVFPKEGETREGDWLYIVNTKTYTQGVRIELCSRPNEKCDDIVNFPNGYESRCVQKYIFRELLGLDRQGKTSKMIFKLPSCCQCIITRERGYE